MSSKKQVIEALDGLLRPLAFYRKKATWNRQVDPYVDVIDVQVSKANHAVTVNVGVLDPAVYVQCWGTDPPGFAGEPSCTVRARIRDPMNGNATWWSFDDENSAEKIVEAVGTHVLPFLERMHGCGAMEDFLIASNDVKHRHPYPPPVIYLALLMNKRGDRPGACTLLNELEKKTLGAWQTRVHEIAEGLAAHR